MTMYRKAKPIRDERARWEWMISWPSRCMACGRNSRQVDFRGFCCHHLIHFRRSDERCNFLKLCGACHGYCHDNSRQVLTVGMTLTIKWLECPDEFDLDRLTVLAGRTLELEDLPDWLERKS